MATDFALRRKVLKSLGKSSKKCSKLLLSSFLNYSFPCKGCVKISQDLQRECIFLKTVKESYKIFILKFWFNCQGQRKTETILSIQSLQMFSYLGHFRTRVSINLHAGLISARVSSNLCSQIWGATGGKQGSSRGYTITTSVNESYCKFGASRTVKAVEFDVMHSL